MNVECNPEKEPAISVLMGVYNEEAHLTKAIDSILGQTFEDFEFLIVDDNSTDQSPKIVESYDDDRIQLIRNDINQGLTVSLNRALDRATGKYIARQDADDISEPRRFERQVSFLEQNEEVALVGTGTYLIDGDDNVVDKRIGYCNPTFEDFLEKSHLVHGSILARRSVLESLGAYDEFFRYGQDYDLWLRLSKHHEVANISEPLYRHRIHDEGVYFSRKDESALYTMFARHLATGKIDNELKHELTKKGITRYYDLLEQSDQEAFHRDLAVRYLRYGHFQQALEECRNAIDCGGISIKVILLSLLALGGEAPTKAARWTMRRYLNVKIKFLNMRFNRSGGFQSNEEYTTNFK